MSAEADAAGLAERVVRALVLYALAECQSGHATTVTLRASGRAFSVADDGRGHGIRRTVDGAPYLDFIYGHLDYPFASGAGGTVQLQGLGMSLINALSASLRVTVRKPAETWVLGWRDGRLAEGEVRDDLPGGPLDQARLARWLASVRQANASVRIVFNGTPLGEG